MAAWTLKEARTQLSLWLEADAAVATGQAYRIGTRQLTRADARAITEKIKFWRAEVERLESCRRGARVMRAVPRDL